MLLLCRECESFIDSSAAELGADFAVTAKGSVHTDCL